MNIGILTSSRADYSIYFPLLKKLFSDNFFNPSIIVFGTHLSKKHGYTISHIINDGFPVKQKIDTIPKNDTPKAISYSMGKTISSFSKLWKSEKYDLIFALGDRYEMFSAVSSSVPFNIPIAHIHGGEVTLGAIDNKFRHAITLMSKFHFTCAEPYKQKVIELTGMTKNVFNTGALSIDNLKKLKLLSVKEFKEKYKIDLNKPTILITFHAETVKLEKNKFYINQLIEALKELSHYQMVITMPNADAMGNMIRKHLNYFIKFNSNAIKVESFGTIGYLSCMKYCAFMLGNTSSAFVEASFFPKKVINIGERQKGRIQTQNIFNCKIKKETILITIKKVEREDKIHPVNIYGNGTAAEKIITILKNIQ